MSDQQQEPDEDPIVNDDPRSLDLSNQLPEEQPVEFAEREGPLKATVNRVIRTVRKLGRT